MSASVIESAHFVYFYE